MTGLREEVYWKASNIEDTIEHGYTNLLKGYKQVRIINNFNNKLEVSAKHGHAKIVEILLQYGGNLNIDIDKLLGNVCTHGHLHTLKMLYSIGIRATSTETINLASVRGYFTVVKFLISNGLNTNNVINNALVQAAYNNQIKIVKYLLQFHPNLYFNRAEAFIDAIADNNIEIVKIFIKAGIDVRYDYNRALSLACERENINMIKFLVLSGADVRTDNYVALLVAVLHNDIETVKILIEHGADIHVDNDRVFEIAEKKGYRQILRLLYQSGEYV
jgi:ankyrin repeat protein